MYRALDPGALKYREPTIGKVHCLFDLVELVVQQFMSEVPGRAVHGPRFAGLFVETDDEPLAFLPQIAFASRIDDMRDLLVPRRNFRHVLRHEILVGHRQKRQVNSRH